MLFFTFMKKKHVKTYIKTLNYIQRNNMLKTKTYHL